MKPIAVLTLALALGAAQTGPVAAFGGVTPKQPQRPSSSYAGQWYTTPDGCSYSRAQAPGYPVMWILIQNPHHIGQPDARPDCPRTL